VDPDSPLENLMEGMTIEENGKKHQVKNLFSFVCFIFFLHLILTFPTIFFLKVYAYYRHELVFFWRFSRPRGVRIMHQCTLCNGNDSIIKTNIWGLILAICFANRVSFVTSITRLVVYNAY
jgi:hypothetical protein